jgi:hypothetical protein
VQACLKRNPPKGVGCFVPPFTVQRPCIACRPTAEEIEAQIRKHERLLHNPLVRLPDGGANVHRRIQQLKDQLQALSVASTATSRTSVDTTHGSSLYGDNRTSTAELRCASTDASKPGAPGRAGLGDAAGGVPSHSDSASVFGAKVAAQGPTSVAKTRFGVTNDTRLRVTKPTPPSSEVETIPTPPTSAADTRFGVTNDARLGVAKPTPASSVVSGAFGKQRPSLPEHSQAPSRQPAALVKQHQPSRDHGQASAKHPDATGPAPKAPTHAPGAPDVPSATEASRQSVELSAPDGSSAAIRANEAALGQGSSARLGAPPGAIPLATNEDRGAAKAAHHLVPPPRMGLLSPRLAEAVATALPLPESTASASSSKDSSRAVPRSTGVPASGESATSSDVGRTEERPGKGVDQEMRMSQLAHQIRTLKASLEQDAALLRDPARRGALPGGGLQVGFRLGMF